MYYIIACPVTTIATVEESGPELQRLLIEHDYLITNIVTNEDEAWTIADSTLGRFYSASTRDDLSPPVWFYER